MRLYTPLIHHWVTRLGIESGRAEDLVQEIILVLLDRASMLATELLTETEYRNWLAQSALQLMRESFSETTWRACWEHVAQGRPLRKVADELGLTENAVYLARGRVLKRLREELDGLWE